MCGIVGLISRRHNGFISKNAEMFTQLLIADTIRGDDSTGVFGVTSGGSVDVLKGDTNGYVFTKSQNYSTIKNKIRSHYHIIVGHNRKATKGQITPENAHPFHEGNIVLVHNGTIWNSDDLNKDVDVDSHAIAHALNENDADTAGQDQWCVCVGVVQHGSPRTVFST